MSHWNRVKRGRFRQVCSVKRSDGIGELNMHGSLGVKAGGVLFGNRVEVLSAAASATVDDCGIQLLSALKFFGEAVATWTPSAGQNFHLATDNTGGSPATPGLDAANCKTAREASKTAIAATRQPNLFARAVQQYYFQNGLTPELCSQIVTQLPNSAKNTQTEIR
ncbi:MAG: hypothetical protein M3O36_17125 [Myxococcota bacterium]|nr:hypothetical protein [Myxococcota bacterium]